MIKRTFGLGLLVLAFTGFFMGNQDERKVINWQTDYAAAVKLANEKGMPILVFFTAEWSVPSQEMLTSVWTNEGVTANAQKFIAVRVDVDHLVRIVSERSGMSFSPSGVLSVDRQADRPVGEQALLRGAIRLEGVQDIEDGHRRG